MPKKQARRSTAKGAAPRSLATTLEDLRAAKKEWSSRLLKPGQRPGSQVRTAPITPDPAWNVQGIGIGEKLVDGRHTGVLAVKFLVRAKYHASHVSKKHALPKSIDGLPVDIEEVGLFRRFRAAGTPAAVPDPRTRIRPAPPGCSVGFADPNNQFTMAGTFGALVRDAGGTLYILSNNHVLADENQLPLGAPVFQPGVLDGGSPNTDQIAQLTRFVGLDPTSSNLVDCAIAAVSDPRQVSDAILQIGQPQGVGDATKDMVVQKFGRATDYRAGRVTMVDTDVNMQYHSHSYKFSGQMIIVSLDSQPFSNDGDSGSLIVERGSNMAVGLLIGGGTAGHSIANDITDVLEKLGVSLA